MTVLVNDVIKFLKGRISLPIYDSFVPESETDTAVALYNITNSQNREITGLPVEKTSFWRLSLVTQTPHDLPDAVTEILRTDNTGDERFQTVYTEIVNTEPREVGSLIQRTFFDLTMYER